MSWSKSILALGLSILIWSCDDKPQRSLKKDLPTKTVKAFEKVERPSFNADSAYVYTKNQVDFGPRVPGSKEHAACANYLEKELQRFGWATQVQNGTVNTFDGLSLPIFNITGKYKPELTNRIMLFAHWDTRPFADRDDNNQNKPILGANDGASGVGVLLEIARAIQQSNVKPSVGIDLVFFDAEDYGQPHNTMAAQSGNTWCLGSQYWANNLPEDFIKPKYGILLDMVGASDATFPKEGGSMQFNKELVEKVWYIGQKLGYKNHFVNNINYGGITDDHVYVSRLAEIPSIDIIHYDPNRGDFGHFHHRHSDNMDIIDPKTLGAVGETMLEVIYRER